MTTIYVKSIDAEAARGLLATAHVILNHGQVTWTTPELAPPFLTTTPYKREDVSALDRFNGYRCPTRWVFSDNGLEIVTCLPWSDTLTTGQPQPHAAKGERSETSRDAYGVSGVERRMRGCEHALENECGDITSLYSATRRLLATDLVIFINDAQERAEALIKSTVQLT
ncbi:uncharacterized protein TNCV_2549671 [Trichonephila clavipes]|nr:uncharacterized protein TNCV_2549671 [Trichonephila clavipes]